jgi:Cytochrome oxidase complex assembly protein 1
MNPPPVPFGDPTQSQRYNRAQTGKGIAFGCGGCAIIVLLVLAFIAGIFLLVFSAIRSSDACTETLAAARANAVLKQELGEPMELGWFITGSVNVKNSHSRADVSLSITGPKDEATVHTVGTRQPGQPWVFTKMNAVTKGSGKIVDLLQH